MNRKSVALVLAMLLLCNLVLMTACTSNETPGTTHASDPNYQVKVTDAQGKPYTTGVIVQFVQDGKQVAMQPVNAEGIAQKVLPADEYQIELVFTDSGIRCYYDKSSAVVSAQKTSVEIVLMSMLGDESTSLFTNSPVTGENKEFTAHHVAVGSTYIPVDAQDRNFLLFTPEKAGTYQFTLDSKDFQIGYYGSPFFVQTQSLEEAPENKFIVSVSEGMIGAGATGTTVLVIGIDTVNAGSEGCVLSIERVGDPEHTIEDEPWTQYPTTAVLSPYKLELAAGQKLNYIDITASTDKHTVVFSETDGFYHYGSETGPVVLMHLGKKAPYISLQTVIMGDGPMGGAPIRCYFYDDDGNFVKKEDYTDILREYFDNMDQDYGVYPLTKDLVYIIENGCSRWWNQNSPDFIFTDCNPELGWMFALCYAA